jgi:hypothetical protein
LARGVYKSDASSVRLRGNERGKPCPAAHIPIGHTARMDTAQRIIVVYGISTLGYGFALGIPMSQTRMRSPQALRHLAVAHLAANHPGWRPSRPFRRPGLSQLTAWLESASALLLVMGSAIFVAGESVNWLQELAITLPNALSSGSCLRRAALGTSQGSSSLSSAS